MREAVIVALGRSAIGKAPKGKLKYSRPEEIGAQVLRGVLDKLDRFDKASVDDVIIGCAFPEAEQGMNMGKIITSRAGLPITVPAQTVNRFCASGLQSIATAANSIIAGQDEVVIAGGVELMSLIPLGGNMVYPNPDIVGTPKGEYTAMGITAENVSDKYGITRQMQDEFAVQSHNRAERAQNEGKFTEEIIPVDAVELEKNEQGIVKVVKRTFDQDEGIRRGMTVEKAAKLKPVFKIGGSVTAGNSSQTSDGAAMVILMEREKAETLGLKPLARFVSFAVTGVSPELMGIGPIKAIPKALAKAEISKDEVDLFELNEAFASQAVACVNELDLDIKKVNVNGGAIAMGHPLGCTGSFLTVKLIHELKRRKQKYGVVSMCIGGGMGAAAVFEML